MPMTTRSKKQFATDSDPSASVTRDATMDHSPTPSRRSASTTSSKRKQRLLDLDLEIAHKLAEVESETTRQLAEVESEKARKLAEVKKSLIRKEMEIRAVAIDEEDIDSRPSSRASSVGTIYDTRIPMEKPPQHALPNSLTYPQYPMGGQTATTIPRHETTSPPEYFATPKSPQIASTDQSDKVLHNFLARQTSYKELPLFTGDPEEWPLFYSQFSSTTRLCGYSDDENIARLAKCLKGRARDAVLALLVSATNMNKIISTLKLRFGRPEYLIETMLAKIRGMRDIRYDDMNLLIEFATVVQNVVETMVMMNETGHLTNPSLIREIVYKLPPTLRLQWGFRLSELQKQIVNLTDLSDWLMATANAATYVAPMYDKNVNMTRSPQPQTSQRRPVLATGSVINTKPVCVMCNDDHNLIDCPAYRKLSVDDRWSFVTSSKLCFSCLSRHHQLRECKCIVKCSHSTCNRVHHESLHVEPRQVNGDGDRAFTMACDDRPVHNFNENQSAVLLKVVRVVISGDYGEFETAALLDEGASVSLIDASFAASAGIHGPTRPLHICGANGMTAVDSNSQTVSFKIRGRSSDSVYDLHSARTVNNLSLPVNSFKHRMIARRYHDYLADFLSDTDVTFDSVKLLIGQDNIDLIVTRQIIRGPKDVPMLSLTSLGYVMHGNVRSKNLANEVSVLHICTCDDLDAAVKRSFRIEDFGTKPLTDTIRSREDNIAVEIMERTTRYIEERKRWETGLLWRDNTLSLPDSFGQASLRLRGIKGKMSKLPEFDVKYHEKINDYVTKGYATKLTNAEVTSNKTWYLPHFAVFNPNKPNKLRFVLDAASKSNGKSLDDFLLPGPDYLNLLPGILLGFRCHQYAVIGDIQEMFHQIEIIKDDRHAQRFLWENDVYEMKDVWTTKIGWDDEIDGSIFDRWKSWLNLLFEVCNQCVPRWFLSSECDPTESVELHVFCDASCRAFASVAYVRARVGDGFRVSLAMARGRVAPLKVLSIPRLELQAALMGARMAQTLKKYIVLTISRVIYWSDSKTVLSWIRSESGRFKPFVAHRVSEIADLTEPYEWRWVPTHLNNADCATREGTHNDSSNWINGPDFLRQTENKWPVKTTTTELQTNDPEIKAVLLIGLPNDNLPNVDRFSNYWRLIRATAWLLRFKHNLRKDVLRSGELISEEVEEAELLWLKECQSKSFPTEIHSLKTSGRIQRDSRLYQLVPFIDSTGILRAHGRIDSANTEYDTKCPIILCSKDKFVKLLIAQFHKDGAHIGQEQVFNNLRQRFWILKGRSAVRATFRECQLCKNNRSKPAPPIMGQIPVTRLTTVRVFNITGLDYFGPMTIKIGRRQEKRYGALFTCMTVRAVHIELVNDLTTSSAIMALRRFIARRGTPQELWSDNATTFRGADRELTKAVADLDEDKIRQFTSIRKIAWRYICPNSPHHGGCWERLVRSVKTALKMTLKERVPTEQTLLTLLSETELMTNSRPLTHVPLDHNDNLPLTPNNFIFGGCHDNTTYPIGDFTDSDLLRKSWRESQRLSDLLWKRWIKEYLPTLTRRGKWYSTVEPLKVGDVVIICDDQQPRNLWPKGTCVKVYPGADGQVRVADVKTATGTYKRPVTKLARLDVSD